MECIQWIYIDVASNNKKHTTMKENLTAHIANIAFSLINQMTGKGVILTQYNSHVEEDIVSTHHTIELLKRLNINIFLHYIENTLHYMTNPENGVRSSLFSVDTLSQLLPDNKDVEALIDEILKTQLQSGAFTKYTAFLHGGDFFSTLWCLKLLMNTENKKYKESIEKGFEFLSKNILDKGISINQKGFFYLLAIKYGYNDFDKSKVKQELISYITDTNIQSDSLLWHLYIYEDILFDSDNNTFKIVKDIFSKTFDLDEKAESIPKVFESLQKSTAESVFLSMFSKILYCRNSIS